MSVYSENLYEDAYPDGVENYYWHSARNRILCKALKSIEFSGVGLDVGCGRGFDAMRFRQSGFDYHGVEAATPRPYYPDSEPYITTGKFSSELDREFREKVTMLSFLDVLPHVDEPLSFLDMHYEHFPNLEYILTWIVGRQELFSNYDKHVGTNKRYTLDECRNVLFKGKEILHLQYCCHLLYLPALLLRLANMNRETVVVPPKTKCELRFHKFLSDYFVWEAENIPYCVYGSSILCLVKVR